MKYYVAIMLTIVVWELTVISTQLKDIYQATIAGKLHP